MNVFIVVLSAIGIAALGASLAREPAHRRHLARLKQRALDEIKALRISAADERYALNGAEATIERVEETGGARGLFDRTADLSVTAHLRNAHGERFLVRWHSRASSGPMVKHLP